MGKCKRATFAKQRGLVITRLMARDGQDCGLCGDPLDRHIDDPEDPRYVTFDHILPLSRGGPDRMDNMRLAHYHCNRARGNQ